MDLTQLLAGSTAEVKVTWEDEVVLVTYLKHAYTPKLEAEVMKEADQGGGRALADLLSQLLDGWDIVDNGEPFPPTHEHLMLLPVSFLVQVMKAISGAMASDPLLSANSEGPS
jgi:hypothetical protein